jgi:hypothetical protein
LLIAANSIAVLYLLVELGKRLERSNLSAHVRRLIIAIYCTFPPFIVFLACYLAAASSPRGLGLSETTSIFLMLATFSGLLALVFYAMNLMLMSRCARAFGAEADVARATWARPKSSDNE